MKAGPKDTRLRPDEVRQIDWTLPEAASSAEVRVWFQQSPTIIRTGWFELGTWSSESKTHVANMSAGDFFGSEKSTTLSNPTTAQIEHR